MQVVARKTRKFLMLSVLVLFVCSFSVSAQDEESINALRQIGKAFSAIAKKASPAVVGIKAEKVYTQQFQHPFFDDPFFDDDFFERFFGQPRERQRQRKPRERKYKRRAQGSGFVISQDGYILTNHHLVGEAEKVSVQFSDKKEVEAKVIGTDPESDVALIKIEEVNLPYLEMADSDALEVGEWVIAIGSPFGLSHTVTAGIVSAKGRSNVGLATYEDFIQTDAAINPGNSGGPLLNLDAKVVGINTAIMSRSGGNMGIGFAIPINMAKSIHEQLKDGGKVVRGYLGVTLNEITPELAKVFELEEAKGAVLSEVLKDSAAEKAGLKHNDIVVEFNGKPVEEVKDLMRRVALLKPGTKVELVVLRDGEKKEFEVELGERPKPEELAGTDKSKLMEELGFEVKNLTEELEKRLGYEGMLGVVVTQVTPDSEAAEKGLASGMLILEVNRNVVENTKNFQKELEKATDEGAIVLLVTNGRYRRFITLNVPEDK